MSKLLEHHPMCRGHGSRGLEDGLEAGEEVVWEGWPLMNLPFPLVFLLPSTLTGAFTKGKLDLQVKEKEGGLMKVPTFLTKDW